MAQTRKTEARRAVCVCVCVCARARVRVCVTEARRASVLCPALQRFMSDACHNYPSPRLWDTVEVNLVKRITAP